MIDPIERTQSFYENISSRRSVRQFSNEKVDSKVIFNAIASAGSAPSGANRQPWHFAVIESDEIKTKIREAAEQVEYDFYYRRASKQWLDDLKPFGTNEHKPYLTDASHLIVVFSHVDHSTYYPLESTGLATGFLLVALHQAGLATLTHTPKPMGFLNSTLGLDKSYRPFMIIVTGHPAAEVQLPNITRKKTSEIISLH